MKLTNTLFATHYPRVFRLTVNKLKAHYLGYGSYQDYQDAASKATTQILENLLVTPSIEITSIESYFYMIASRRFVDAKRSSKRFVYPENMPVIAVEKPYKPPLSMEAIPMILDELPRDIQQIMELKYRVLSRKTLANMSLSAINKHQQQPCLNYKAIAKELGVEKEGALRQRLSRLKPLLKARLQEVA
jgi:DNA-directed RNA polymerase specialized sigma24 family protein